MMEIIVLLKIKLMFNSQKMQKEDEKIHLLFVFFMRPISLENLLLDIENYYFCLKNF